MERVDQDRNINMVRGLVGLPVISFLVFTGAFASHGIAQQQPSQFSSEAIELFENKIRPVLASRCYSCHSLRADSIKGDLRLDSREGILKGGESGPVVVPGDPEQSRLITAIRGVDEDLKMPPNGKKRLSRQQVADFIAWVRLGAPDPRTESDAPYEADIDEGEARKFWSFRPVEDPPLPAVRDEIWPRNGIDHFILARLEEKGLKPVEDAGQLTLIRRATYDLLGLPPTPQQIDAFLVDDPPRAYANLVDRLLDSAHYGERWGRHWLDVVRYADTAGDSADYPIPQAYRYRDYVINALNKDKPYDQFVREQIAGDVIPSPNLDEKFERTIATGFIALARRSGEDPDEEHYITIGDTIDTMGSSFLALNLQCASCHDHKFDPIPTADYYALYGIFESTRYPYPGSDHKKYQRDFVPLLPVEQAEKIAKPVDKQLASLEAELLPLAEELLIFENAVGGIVSESEAAKVKMRTLEELKEAASTLGKKCDQVGRSRPVYPDAYAVSEGSPRDAAVHINGNPEKLGAEVPRGFLGILGGPKVPADEEGSGRRQLAQWLPDSRNPLTARVMVNRIWQYHFGKGIVQTPNVFGTNGTPPTHPNLLDYLASRFVESGWSIKAMHRLIMLSRTYQHSKIVRTFRGCWRVSNVKG